MCCYLKHCREDSRALIGGFLFLCCYSPSTHFSKWLHVLRIRFQYNNYIHGFRADIYQLMGPHHGWWRGYCKTGGDKRGGVKREKSSQKQETPFRPFFFAQKSAMELFTLLLLPAKPQLATKTTDLSFFCSKDKTTYHRYVL